jgi:hypothetical protein
MQRKKTALNLDDSTTYYYTSHAAWLSRWADSCTIYVVVVDLITHTQGNLLCSPGIVWIVASFLSWMTWGIHVLEVYGLLQVSCLEWFEEFMSWWLLFCCMSFIVILFTATFELCGFNVRNNRRHNIPPSGTTNFELLSNNFVTLSNSPGACSKNIHLVCMFGSVQLELQFLWSSQNPTLFKFFDASTIFPFRMNETFVTSN